MSYYIRRHSDANHKSVIAALQKNGIKVVDLSGGNKGIPDLLTYYRGRICFIEVKIEKGAKLKKTQVKFLGEWRGACGIAQTEEGAIALATGADYGLSDDQRDRLLIFHRTMDAKEVALGTILKVINGQV